MRQGRPPGTGKLAPFQAFLVGEVEKKPDITMPELAAQLMKEHGITATPAALSRLLCRNGFTYKTYGPPRLQESSEDRSCLVCTNVSGLEVSASAKMEIRAP